MNEKQRQLALDVMTNAVETGAIGYWATMHERPTRVKLEDGEIGDIESFKIIDTEADSYDSENQMAYLVEPNSILAAMEKIMKGEASVRSDLRQNIGVMYLLEDYCADGVPGGDAETDDVIVQIACFGELVYG